MLVKDKIIQSDLILAQRNDKFSKVLEVLESTRRKH